MERLVLVAVGDLELQWLELLHESLPDLIGRRCRIDPHALEPGFAANGPRRQYNANLLVEALVERVVDPGERVLGVTRLDLYLSVFTFVFGAAHLEGSGAVVSMHRLDPSKYGLEPDPALLPERLIKEAMHECGHLYGAVHCRTPECVMGFSAVVEEIDIKSSMPCPECARGIGIPPGTIGDQGA